MKATKVRKRRRQSAWQSFSVQPWLWAGLLVLLVIAVYWPTLSNGFIWDDDAHVEMNRTLRSAGGLADIWFHLGATPQYYPLVHTTFWVEYHLWGLTPRGYHAVNMALHAGCVLLVWRLLVRLAVPGAWLAAAIFAVHPVEVESVAWITERKNVLSCLFALAALLAYLAFSPPVAIEEAQSGPTSRRQWWAYGASLLLYLAALWSKTVTASVPAVLLVIAWWKRGRISRRDILPVVPMFVVGLAMASLTAWMERAHVRAVGADWDLSPVERVLIAGRAVWFYAGKLVCPYPLVFFYPKWQIDAHAVWQYAFPLLALAVIAVLWLARERIGRGPLAAVLIFAGVLLPALGFFNVFPFRYSYVADHFQYHASISLIALLVAGLVGLGDRLARSVPWAGRLAAAGLLAGLALVANRRTHAFEMPWSPWEDTLAHDPESWAAHVNLGGYLRQDRRYEEAISHFNESLRIAPERASARLNLGHTLFLMGRLDEAFAELERSLQGDLSKTDQALAHVYLSDVLISQKRYDEAGEQARAALELNPYNVEALYNYGAILAAQGDTKGGIDRIEAALAIDPAQHVAQHRLGILYASLGNNLKAASSFEKAVTLAPDVPEYRRDLAVTYMKLGDPLAAAPQLRAALAINRRDADAENLLGAVYQKRGDLRGAAEHYRAALAIDPQHAAGENLRRLQELIQRSGRQGP